MKKAILSESKQELVSCNRTVALKIARSLLRRWDVYLEMSEIQSHADMALCEAARGFDPQRGTRFVTYLFPYIKGALISELKFAKRSSSSQHTPSSNVGKDDYLHDEDTSVSYTGEPTTDESDSPEYHTYRRELQAICRQALASLQPLERETLIGVDMLDDKVAQLARRIGYSRPYLSSVRTRALCKIQPFLERMAA